MLLFLPGQSLPGETPGPPVANRLRAVMMHVPWYSIEGAARLAADVGCARSSISRLLSGKVYPSPLLAQRICRALSRRLKKRRLRVEEVFTRTGVFPTASTCELCGTCRGCLPDWAYDHRGKRKRDWEAAMPGEWCHYALFEQYSP